MKIQEKEESSQVGILSNASHPKQWQDIVGHQLGIGHSTAHRLDYAATTMDSLAATGKTEEAEAVRQALNKSAKAGHETEAVAG